MPEVTGATCGKYQIVEELGKGGFATVYRAMDTTLGRVAAIRILKASALNAPAFLERFRREARTVAALNHPHITAIHEVGELQGQHFIAMPYLSGPTLGQVITQHGAMDPGQVIRIAQQVASALDHAHQKGVIHGDVKPANVLFDSRRNAILTDFGIAKTTGETAALTRAGITLGTPQYMAPEHWMTGKIDERADMYALGIMLYRMLTGKVPSDGETSRVVHSQVNASPPPPRAFNPALPAAMEPVFLRALAKDPAQRYPTAGQMVAALHAALMTHLPEDSELSGRFAPLPPPARIPAPTSPQGVQTAPARSVATQPGPVSGAPPAVSSRSPGRWALWGGIAAGLLLFAVIVVAGLFIVLFGQKGTELSSPTAAPSAVSTSQTLSATSSRSLASFTVTAAATDQASHSSAEAAAPSGLLEPVDGQAFPAGAPVTLAFLSNPGRGWAIWLAVIGGSNACSWLAIRPDWGEADPNRLAQERMSWSP